ncbi:MAG TPA: hypothetical protein VGI10_25900 [Polyangiaceae bacterium]
MIRVGYRALRRVFPASTVLSVVIGCGNAGTATPGGAPGVPTADTVSSIPANAAPIVRPEDLDGSVSGVRAPGPSWAGTVAMTSVSAASWHSCGVTTSNTLLCWGRGTTPPSDPSACQASGDCGQALAPAGAFSAVSAGSNHSCALRLDGTIACFGAGTTDQNCVNDECGQSLPPSGNFVAVSVGGNHSCALGSDSRVVCWGAGRRADACTIGQCGQALPPDGTFKQVTAGYQHTCGLLVDGTVQCWGDNLVNELAAPAGTFTKIESGGSLTTCGLRSDGTLECWGDQDFSPPPLPGVFSDFAVSTNFGCGIDAATGIVVCWGQQSGYATNPPLDPFREISLGDAHGCGVRADDGVECWGDDLGGRAEPP